MRAKNKIDEVLYTKWAKKGYVFGLSDYGLKMMHEHEKSLHQESFEDIIQKTPPIKPSSKYIDLRAYINYGDSK